MFNKIQNPPKRRHCSSFGDFGLRIRLQNLLEVLCNGGRSRKRWRYILLGKRGGVKTHTFRSTRTDPRKLNPKTVNISELVLPTIIIFHMF